MSTVYQHQLHHHKPHRSHAKRWIAAIVIIVAVSTVVGLRQLKADTTVTGAATVTRKLESQSATETFQKGTFSIELPRGWQFTGKQQDVYTIYHFKSALGGEAGNREMDIYEDSDLPNFAVNRMVPVTANGSGGLLAEVNKVSDNCEAYTTSATTNRGTGSGVAKWQGIEFLCDQANTLRNVVGTGSTDGLNRVNVDSLSTKHHYFMTYTESNAKPDYSIFTAAINSFKVTQ